MATARPRQRTCAPAGMAHLIHRSNHTRNGNRRQKNFSPNTKELTLSALREISGTSRDPHDLGDDAATASLQESVVFSFCLGLHMSRLKKEADQRKKEVTRDCVGCGDPIPKKRQAAVPWTQLCIACQWEHERTHGIGLSNAATIFNSA